MAVSTVVVFDTEVDSSGAALPNLAIEATLVQSKTVSLTQVNVSRVKGLTDSTGRWQPYPLTPSPVTANAAGGLTLVQSSTYLIEVAGKPAHQIATPANAGPVQASTITVSN